MFMNIGRQVREAIDKMGAGDFGQALIHVLLAVAATSKKTFGRKVPDNRAFKDFVRDNMGVVTSFGLNVAQLGGLQLGKPSQPIEDILYDVRCHVVHSLELPLNIQFTDNTIGGVDPLLIPTPIINGLIAAVVVAPVNSREYGPFQ